MKNCGTHHRVAAKLMLQPMLLEIETHGFAVLFDLLVGVEPGARCRVPGGAVLHLPKLPPLNPGPGAPARIALRLECGWGIDSEVTGNWLYEKLKGRVESLRVDGTDVPIEREAITRRIKAGRGKNLAGG
jgi:hypothetical protein